MQDLGLGRPNIAAFTFAWFSTDEVLVLRLNSDGYSPMNTCIHNDLALYTITFHPKSITPSWQKNSFFYTVMTLF